MPPAPPGFDTPAKRFALPHRLALTLCVLLAGLTLVGVRPVAATWKAWPPGVDPRRWPPLSARAVTDTAGPVVDVADAPRPWSRGDDGWLLAPAPGDSVVLRAAPFSAESLWLERGRLPGDAHVFVLETRVDGGGTWVLVRPLLADVPSGWVHAKQLGHEPRWVDLDTPAEAEIRPWTDPALDAPSDRPPGVPGGVGFGLSLAVGASVLSGAGGQRLDDEYADGGLVVEIEALDYRSGVLALAVGMGYRRYNGTAAREYAFPDRIVVPDRTRSTLGYAMAELGARGEGPRGLRAGVLAGPVVALVHEEADAKLLSPGSRLPLGDTTSTLDRLAFGGGGTAWLGFALPDPAELALRLRLLGLGWRGQRELPLAIDWVDNGLWHADLALVVTFANP